MALEISTGPAGESAAEPNTARTPHRFVVARRALLVAAIAVVVDLTSITLAYTIANAARRFLDTMVEATPVDLTRAYGWPAATARTELDAARDRGSQHA